MRQAAKTFVAVFVFGCTLVGAYLGALAVKLTWAFWIIVPVAVVVALTRATAPRILDWLTRIRNYDKVLKAAAASEASVRRLQGELEMAAGKSTQSFRAGVQEGRAQAIGIFFALTSAAEIVPEAVSMENDLQIHGRLTSGQLPEVGTRLALEVAMTGEVKGIVEVIQADSEGDVVVMACVRRLVEPFWKHLEESTIGGPAFPPGLRLVTATLDLYAELENDHKEQHTNGN